MTNKLPTKAWLDYASGVLNTPKKIYRAFLAERIENESRFLHTPPDTLGVFDAPKRLRTPDWFYTKSILHQWESADFQQCDPRLILWASRFQDEARKWQIPLYVHSAFRTEAEQAELLRRKVTKVGYPRSAHNIGEAVDIVHGKFHWDMTEQEWKFLATLGRRVLDRLNAGVKKSDQLHLEWGGDWSFYDPAHWEIKDYRTRIRPLKAGQPLRWTPRGYIAKHGK